MFSDVFSKLGTLVNHMHGNHVLLVCPMVYLSMYLRQVLLAQYNFRNLLEYHIIGLLSTHG